MIIQEVLKGISGITVAQAQEMLRKGILCNWWRNAGIINAEQIPSMLTPDKLYWHQNKYHKPDKDYANAPFHVNTPFISLTAGVNEQDITAKGIGKPRASTVFMTPAWQTALKFATGSGTKDGFIFSCYVFILGRKSIEHQGFSEEVRETNIYNALSPFHYQGEVTAKIIIPPAQIEKCEFFSASQFSAAFKSGALPSPAHPAYFNPLFQNPGAICNIRSVLFK